jgi:ABC-type transport system involved in cytochrome bd biosynthesis fused ATPase/permease subunit
MVGLTGRSGKGKTTILNLVLGFLAPDQGTISINNKELRKNELKKYWPSISYVRQQSFLIHDTVLRNITLEEDKYDKEKLDTALKISGLDELLLTYEEGLQKIITENGKNISGGQQQRIALARALYKDADLILLDEPFNELDETSEILMLEHFRELAKKGKIVIMITHDKKSLSYCTKTISLDGP